MGVTSVMCLFLVIMDMNNMKAKPRSFYSVLFDDINQTPLLFDKAITLALDVDVLSIIAECNANGCRITEDNDCFLEKSGFHSK